MGRVSRVGTGRGRCPKTAYSSKKAAKAMAHQQTRNSGELIEAYHCYRCHCYHLGHPPKPFDPEYSAGEVVDG